MRKITKFLATLRKVGVKFPGAMYFHVYLEYTRCVRVMLNLFFVILRPSPLLLAHLFWNAGRFPGLL